MTEHTNRFIHLMERIQEMQNGQPQMQQLDTGLSWSQMTVLRMIMRHPGSQLQELAEKLEITAPSASVGVRKLEDADWLERKPDPDDRRATRIFPTEKAQQMVETFRHFRQESMSQFLSGLDQQEQVQFLDLFEKAVAAAERSVQLLTSEIQ